MSSPSGTTPPAPLTAITNAHVVPIDGEPFDGTVVVEDGRITALGRARRRDRDRR
jgi:hypothetical protein